MAVLGGCGAAVLAAGFGKGDLDTVNLGLGFVGVSLAFGLSVVTGAYALGHVSGGHFNPAVTLGLTAAGKFAPAKVAGYIIAQVIGGIVAGGVIYLIASGQADWAINGDDPGAFATNPVTNTSVNPARSTAMAVFAGSNQIGQLWLFWVAPIVGAVLGALIWKTLLDVDDDADGIDLRDVVTSAKATAKG